LKTAEALYSGNNIVATKIAMRGFTEFAQNHSVKIAQSDREFRQVLVESLQSEKEKSSKSLGLAQNATWEQQLSELGNWLGKSINKVSS
jgi:hypothetical protein